MQILLPLPGFIHASDLLIKDNLLLLPQCTLSKASFEPISSSHYIVSYHSLSMIVITHISVFQLLSQVMITDYLYLISQLVKRINAVMSHCDSSSETYALAKISNDLDWGHRLENARELEFTYLYMNFKHYLTI